MSILTLPAPIADPDLDDLDLDPIAPADRPTRTSTKAARPAGGTCGLTLSINGVRYRVRPIPCGDFGAVKAFRLAKQGGKGDVYDLVAFVDHAACDCPDFTFHRDGRDPAGCKHLKAARACGLI